MQATIQVQLERFARGCAYATALALAHHPPPLVTLHKPLTVHVFDPRPDLANPSRVKHSVVVTDAAGRRVEGFALVCPSGEGEPPRVLLSPELDAYADAVRHAMGAI